MPGALAPGDLELILQQQQGDASPEEATAWLLEHFQASDGSTAMKLVDGRPTVFKIPTIVPRLTEQGCVFLRDGRCSIHSVSPFGCAFLDMHMPDDAATQRSHAVATLQLQAWQSGDSYSQAWNVLAAAGKMASSLQSRRRALLAAQNEIEGREPRG